jgi:hypothetical protein
LNELAELQKQLKPSDATGATVLQIAYHFAQRSFCMENQLKGQKESSKHAQLIALS